METAFANLNLQENSAKSALAQLIATEKELVMTAHAFAIKAGKAPIAPFVTFSMEKYSQTAQLSAI
jgi:hypothetical protein